MNDALSVRKVILICEEPTINEKPFT